MSRSKTPKQPLTPANLRRLLEDGEHKAELKGEGVVRVLSEALKHGDAVIAGGANDLEVEAVFKRLYLVFTEIEAYHRACAADPIDGLADAKMAQLVTRMGKNVMRVHDAMRKVLTISDLVLIDLRRHAACHVSVDGNQIRLVGEAVLDRRQFPILGGLVLTVEQQDEHLGKARSIDEIAKRVRKGLALLLVVSLPLHTPVHGWSNNKVHVVEEGDGTWQDIAVAARVDLAVLLDLNAGDDGPPGADAVPRPGAMILVPLRATAS